MSNAHATDEAFWERIRSAYPTQQPLLNLNNAAVSPPASCGREVTCIEFDLTASDEDIFKAYEAGITLKTRVTQITHMLHWNGRANPGLSALPTA
ncbi:MAG: hypothetical protein ACREYA_20080 [Cupriavidus necator]